MRPLLLLLNLGLLLLGFSPPSQAQEPTTPAASQHFVYLPTIHLSSISASEQSPIDDDEGPLTATGTLVVQFGAEQIETAVATNGMRAMGRTIPSTIATLQVTNPLTFSSNITQVIGAPTAVRQRVVVRLREPALGSYQRAQGQGAAAQPEQFARIAAQQTRLISLAQQLDSQVRVIGQVTKALNALLLEIESASLAPLAADPDVLTITPIRDYRLALSYTVPYIGARTVQQLGYDGHGVRVAVLDSGIDYTHADLGGSGNPDDYTNNDPTRLEVGTFPTAKVVGGIDLVGSNWPDTPEMPDPDPLDDGPTAGHGTHVADIIGGRRGVAPGVALYAVKVCSSRSSACSGAALLQALDYILDPNGDGDLSDAMHVINLSISSDYGSAFDDELSTAIETVSALGVVVVVAAGNGGDKPYVLGTPAATPSAFAVAQTHVPVALQPFPLTNPLTTNTTAALRQERSENLLTKYLVDSSARGPSMGANLAKPDIGAPGTSVSAVAGSGTGQRAFGGTSGAAPLISGALALLRQAYPARTGAELKALLMNTAETAIFNQSPLRSTDLAPITRIGSGEVRVDQALRAQAAAWENTSQTGSLAFGFYDVTSKRIEYTRTVTVRNYGDRPLHYQIYPRFRFANDKENSGVEIDTPDELTVPAHSDAHFVVELEIEGNELRPWQLNAGAQGADGALLTLLEYDGYIELVEEQDANHNLHLAWHILPRRASQVLLSPQERSITLTNHGVATTTVESYALIGISDNLPNGVAGAQRPTPDLRYLGYTTYSVPVSVCNPTTPSFVLVFAATTWERQTHANAPASYNLELDTDQDGRADYRVMTRDYSFTSNSDGRNLTWVVDLRTWIATAFFFTSHDTNSANTVMTLCAEQIGLTAADVLRPIQVTTAIEDTYYGGPGDRLPTVTIAPFGERYVAYFTKGGLNGTTLVASKKDRLRVLNYGTTYNNTEQGLLLLFRGGAPVEQEAGIVLLQPMVPSQP
ncbi:MAG: S8 family serine peptidase [Caldilineaceae bacterium]|nr:S8 family serine peptidase [Caldilineaceae bacterium]